MLRVDEKKEMITQKDIERETLNAADMYKVYMCSWSTRILFTVCLIGRNRESELESRFCSMRVFFCIESKMFKIFCEVTWKSRFIL